MRHADERAGVPKAMVSPREVTQGTEGAGCREGARRSPAARAAEAPRGRPSASMRRVTFMLKQQEGCAMSHDPESDPCGLPRARRPQGRLLRAPRGPWSRRLGGAAAARHSPPAPRRRVLRPLRPPGRPRASSPGTRTSSRSQRRTCTVASASSPARSKHFRGGPHRGATAPPAAGRSDASGDGARPLPRPGVERGAGPGLSSVGGRRAASRVPAPRRARGPPPRLRIY